MSAQPMTQDTRQCMTPERSSASQTMTHHLVHSSDDVPAHSFVSKNFCKQHVVCVSRLQVYQYASTCTSTFRQAVKSLVCKCPKSDGSDLRKRERRIGSLQFDAADTCYVFDNRSAWPESRHHLALVTPPLFRVRTRSPLKILSRSIRAGSHASFNGDASMRWDKTATRPLGPFPIYLIGHVRVVSLCPYTVFSHHRPVAADLPSFPGHSTGSPFSRGEADQEGHMCVSFTVWVPWTPCPLAVTQIAPFARHSTAKSVSPQSFRPSCNPRSTSASHVVARHFRFVPMESQTCHHPPA